MHACKCTCKHIHVHVCTRAHTHMCTHQPLDFNPQNMKCLKTEYGENWSNFHNKKILETRTLLHRICHCISHDYCFWNCTVCNRHPLELYLHKRHPLESCHLWSIIECMFPEAVLWPAWDSFSGVSVSSVGSTTSRPSIGLFVYMVCIVLLCENSWR